MYTTIICSVYICICVMMLNDVLTSQLSALMTSPATPAPFFTMLAAGKAPRRATW